MKKDQPRGVRKPTPTKPPLPQRDCALVKSAWLGGRTFPTWKEEENWGHVAIPSPPQEYIVNFLELARVVQALCVYLNPLFWFGICSWQIWQVRSCLTSPWITRVNVLQNGRELTIIQVQKRNVSIIIFWNCFLHFQKILQFYLICFLLWNSLSLSLQRLCVPFVLIGFLTQWLNYLWKSTLNEERVIYVGSYLKGFSPWLPLSIA